MTAQPVEPQMPPSSRRNYLLLGIWAILLILTFGVATSLYAIRPAMIPLALAPIAPVTLLVPKWIVWVPPVGILLTLVLTGIAERDPLRFYTVPIPLNDLNRERVCGTLREMNTGIRTSFITIFIAMNLMLNGNAAWGFGFTLFAVALVPLTVYDGYKKLQRHRVYTD